MLEKIHNFIAEKNLLSNDKPVFVALSGGIDSVALLHILHRLGYQCVAGHINHNLRGQQSDADEQFVRELAAQLGIKMSIKSCDVKGYAHKNALSIETAGRILRIENLIQMAKSNNCQAIATAHHSDDNVETIVYRLLRGTGFRGLAGIRPSNKINDFVFVRPLLCVDKGQIKAFSNANGINWRSDLSNFEMFFARNRIRHQLLPFLEENCKSVRELLLKLSQNSLKLAEKLEKQAENCSKTIISHIASRIEIDLTGFNKIPKPIAQEILRQTLDQAGVGLQDMNFNKYDEIFEIARNRCGTVNLPNSHKVEIMADKLIIHDDGPKNIAAFLKIGKIVEFEGIKVLANVFNAEDVDFSNFLKSKDKSAEWYDFDLINGDLTLRRIENGDKFTPMGRKSARKIGDFIKDKFNPVITDNQQILWIVNVRRFSGYEISDKTKRILELKVL